MSTSSKAYGIIAEFETSTDILHAAERVHRAGFRRWDVFTPFPVHGMDRAMGLKSSPIPAVALRIPRSDPLELAP